MTLVPHESNTGWMELVGPAGQLADRICKTDFVPSAMRNRPEAVLACILTGHEVGIGPMMALSKIHVVDARPTMAAELMRALILRAGHEIWTEDFTQTRVTVCGKRVGSSHVSQVTWTMDEAKRAGLAGKRNWQQYPRAMLLARATSELARLMFADVIGGISYSLEELEDGDLETPPPAPAGADQQQKTTSTRKAPAARSRTKKPPAPPPAEPELPGEEPPARGRVDSGGMPVAQRIAMRAREAGIDHHQVVAAVTSGTKTSAMDLTDVEAAAVLEAIGQLTRGELRLVATEGASWPSLQDTEADDGVEDAEVVEDQPPLPGEEAPAPARPPVDEWTSADWRSFLEEKGVRMADVLREAYRLAPDYDTVPPVTLEQLAQRKKLAAAMKDYVDGFGRDDAA